MNEIRCPGAHSILFSDLVDHHPVVIVVVFQVIVAVVSIQGTEVAVILIKETEVDTIIIIIVEVMVVHHKM